MKKRNIFFACVLIVLGVITSFNTWASESNESELSLLQKLGIDEATITSFEYVTLVCGENTMDTNFDSNTRNAICIESEGSNGEFNKSFVFGLEQQGNSFELMDFVLPDVALCDHPYRFNTSDLDGAPIVLSATAHYTQLQYNDVHPIGVSFSYVNMDNLPYFVSSIKATFGAAGLIFDSNGDIVYTYIPGIEWGENNYGSYKVIEEVATPAVATLYRQNKSFPEGYYIWADNGGFGYATLWIEGSVLTNSGGVTFQKELHVLSNSPYTASSLAEH